ncbi:MAG: IS4 family transposase [Phycisphaeraceae bacterium]|nr:IS4 family transposase [Phycisphaeraceae bacterium]
MNTIRTSFTQVKKQFKDYLTPAMILGACREKNHIFRKRLLGPVETIIAFCLQVLNGNTACAAVRHWLGIDISDSAYCQARQRISVDIFKNVLRRVTCSLNQESSDELWNGRRVCLVDGTSFSMPDTNVLHEEYGKPTGQKKGCGFPVSELLVMVHWSTGMILDLFAMPWKEHEQSKVSELHPSLRKGDVLVADRGFCSYGHVAQLYQKGIDTVFRVQQAIIVDFRRRRPHATNKWHPEKGLPRSKWIRSLGKKDQIVCWQKPAKFCRSKHLGLETWNALPTNIMVRELAYTVETPGYRTKQITLVTTLLDAEIFTKEQLADLYLIRWRIEVNFRDLKTTMGMDILKCKTVEGISKELLVFALIYNMVMAIRYRSSQMVDVCPSRISFVDILRHVRIHGFVLPDTVIVNPSRPGRWQPRVVKRRPKSYPLMTKPRGQYIIGDDKKS